MNWNRIGTVAGRALMSVIFLVSGAGKMAHFSGVAGMMSKAGLPAASALLALSIAIEIGAGLLLLTGFKARYAALLLAAWLVPVSLTMHNFWAYTGAQQQEQMVNFLKNLALIGGLLYFGVQSAGTTGKRTLAASK